MTNDCNVFALLRSQSQAIRRSGFPNVPSNTSADVGLSPRRRPGASPPAICPARAQRLIGIFRPCANTHGNGIEQLFSLNPPGNGPSIVRLVIHISRIWQMRQLIVCEAMMRRINCRRSNPPPAKSSARSSSNSG